MKKILVVLLILAVAGGVFAQQGSWGLWGGAEVGTRVNFDPQPDVDKVDDPAIVGGIAYHDWDALTGKFGIGYNRDNVEIKLGLATKGDSSIETNFNGDNFKSQFVLSNPMDILNNRFTVGRLWGQYGFFNGAITLVAAYRNADTEYWVSDKTGTLGGSNIRGPGDDSRYLNGWLKGNPFDDGNTFTKNDNWMGNDLLMVNAQFSAIDFGVLIPNIFQYSKNWADFGGDPSLDNGSHQDAGEWYENYGHEFINGAIKRSIIGVSFKQSPLEIAAQFQLANYGVYFGGKFFAGPVTVGLSFTGILDGDGDAEGAVADPKTIKLGGRVDFNGGDFGGGVKGFYERAEMASAGVKDEFYTTLIGIEPTFYYNAIPSHLRFALDVGFYFPNFTNGSDSTKATIWALQPQLLWNFLGTGAGGYWNYNTGILARYRIANADVRDLGFGNNSVNFLDLVFKWGF